MTFLIHVLFLATFQVSTADFVQVAGADIESRSDNAVRQGRNGSNDTFWVGFQFSLEEGVRIDSRNGNFNVNRGTTAVRSSDDGIIWMPENGELTQRAGVFFLTRKSDGAIRRTRVLDLDQNYEIRDRPVYWAGLAAADESVDLLSRLVGEPGTRNTSTFMMLIGLHPTERATDKLIDIARGSLPTDVKKEALFWLGQEVNQRAGEALPEVVMAETPEVEVQKQAVFAISRRDDDESIPLLIEVAEDHPNLAVRKQAIFWLGRKEDPRVISLFERLLRN
jgi:hypothetical protein